MVPNEDRSNNFGAEAGRPHAAQLVANRLSTRSRRGSRVPRAARRWDIDFGASVFRVVSLDLSDEVFEHDGTPQLRKHWQPRLQRR